MVLDDTEIAQVARVVASMPGLYRAPTKKPRVAWEKSLVREWTTRKYPNSLQWANVRVGEIDDPQQTGQFKFLRKWCDAVVYDGERTMIVEAKMIAQVAAISQLTLYCRLFPKTPEFEALKGEPFIGVLLSARYDPDVEEMCKDAGHVYEVYVPSFMEEFERVLAETKRRH